MNSQTTKLKSTQDELWSTATMVELACHSLSVTQKGQAAAEAKYGANLASQCMMLLRASADLAGLPVPTCRAELGNEILNNQYSPSKALGLANNALLAIRISPSENPSSLDAAFFCQLARTFLKEAIVLGKSACSQTAQVDPKALADKLQQLDLTIPALELRYQSVCNTLKADQSNASESTKYLITFIDHLLQLSQHFTRLAQGKASSVYETCWWQQQSAKQLQTTHPEIREALEAQFGNSMSDFGTSVKEGIEACGHLLKLNTPGVQLGELWSGYKVLDLASQILTGILMVG